MNGRPENTAACRPNRHTTGGATPARQCLNVEQGEGDGEEKKAWWGGGRLRLGKEVIERWTRESRGGKSRVHRVTSADRRSCDTRSSHSSQHTRAKKCTLAKDTLPNYASAACSLLPRSV